MYKKVLFALIALMMFTVILGACSIKDSSTLNNGVPVKLGPSTFIPTEIKLKKGERIAFNNSLGVKHIITNGTWDGATQKPGAESGAPTFTDDTSGGMSFSPPFTTAGTFKLYCTLHQGMNLTVIVT